MSMVPHGLQRRRLLGAALALAAAPGAAAQSWAWDDGTVPFVVTPDDAAQYEGLLDPDAYQDLLDQA